MWLFSVSLSDTASGMWLFSVSLSDTASGSWLFSIWYWIRFLAIQCLILNSCNLSKYVPLCSPRQIYTLNIMSANKVLTLNLQVPGWHFVSFVVFPYGRNVKTVCAHLFLVNEVEFSIAKIHSYIFNKSLHSHVGIGFLQKSFQIYCL